MSSQTQQASSLDKVKWALAIITLVGAGYANAYYGDLYPALYRFIVLVALLIGSMLLVSTTSQGRAFIGLAKDARLEMKKVVWPKKNETLVTSGFVVLVVIFFSIVLWLVDSVLRWAISFLIG